METRSYPFGGRDAISRRAPGGDGRAVLPGVRGGVTVGGVTVGAVRGAHGVLEL